MAWSESFLPQVNHQTRILILGSMPGIKSLEDAQYYAHPRNAFWLIMQHLLSIDKLQPYPQRLQALNGQALGLWDVYHRCFRAGSLDSAIEKDSAQVNDFELLFRTYPQIEHVFFNGKAAESAFNKHFSNMQLADFLTNKTCQVLPSTSPANAAMSVDEKTLVWTMAIEAVL